MIRETGADVVVVLTTLPADQDVTPLARTLIEEGRAACVTALPGARSVYRWEREIESSEEQQVLLKTTSDQIDGLRERLIELHPYDVPELLVLPVGGSAAYLEWVRGATGEGRSEQP